MRYWYIITFFGSLNFFRSHTVPYFLESISSEVIIARQKFNVKVCKVRKHTVALLTASAFYSTALMSRWPTNERFSLSVDGNIARRLCPLQFPVLFPSFDYSLLLRLSLSLSFFHFVFVEPGSARLYGGEIDVSASRYSRYPSPIF